MLKRRAIWFATIAAIASSEARADMRALLARDAAVSSVVADSALPAVSNHASGAREATPSSPPGFRSSPSGADGGSVGVGLGMLGGSMLGPFEDPSVDGQSYPGLQGQADGANVREIPPLPGSLQLFLSGLLTFGAWHVVRYGRGAHIASLPEWYHSGGPAQVGHAVAYDLNSTALPICCFEQPAETASQTRFLRAREYRPRRTGQFVISPAGPRAPPLRVAF